MDVAGRFYFEPESGGLVAVSGRRAPERPVDAVAEMEDVAWALEMLNQATTLDARHVRSSWAGLRTFTADRPWRSAGSQTCWASCGSSARVARIKTAPAMADAALRHTAAGSGRPTSPPWSRPAELSPGAVQMRPPTTSTVAATVGASSTAARVHPRSR